VTQFDASLIVADDPTPLPTTVELNEGNLILTSGDQPIGTWSLDQVELSRVLGGYRFEADGETVTLKIPEADTFGDELDGIIGSSNSKKKREKKPKADKPAKAKVEPAKYEPVAATTKQSPKQKDDVAPLDVRLEAAHQRFGKYLPDWLFTKGGLIVVGVSLLAMVIFRQTFSALFLIAAAVGLTASAVGLVDQVIASRIFRGRITAVQGLIVSLSVGLVGLLLGGI
jgi:hypothetical protein